MVSGQHRSSLLLAASFLGALLTGSTVRAQTRPDLDVLEVRLQGANAVARVRNGGAPMTATVYMQWRANGIDLTPLLPRGPVASGETFTTEIPFSYTPGQGEVLLRFDVDVNDDVRESDEANNSRQILIQSGATPVLPDLLVSGLTVQPPAAPNEDALVIASLTNIGGAATGTFRIRWYLGGALYRDEEHPNLPPLQSSSDDAVRYRISMLYVNQLRFEADTDNNVLEYNETNNGVPRPLADLTAPGSMRVQSLAGGGVRLTADARNIGLLDSDRYFTQWSLDGTGLAPEEQPSLTPNSGQRLSIDLTPPPGIHRIGFAVDVTDVVSELSERNNFFEREVDYRPDLFPNVSFTDPVKEGAPTTIVGFVFNWGFAPADTYRVQLIVDGTLVVDRRLGPLDAGGQAENRVEYPWTPSITTDQRHTVDFRVDLDREVDEQCRPDYCGDDNNDILGNVINALPPDSLSVTLSLLDQNGVPVPASVGLNDGWPSPNPVTVRVTVTNNRDDYAYPSADLEIDSTDGLGHFYLESESLPSAQRVAHPGNDFSYRWFAEALLFTGGLAPRESRTFNWQVWVQPSDATTLRFSAVAQSTPSDRVIASATLVVPAASIHPVVFLHGILGSMPPQNKLITDSSRFGEMEILDPFLGSYWPLMDNLQKMGYEINKSLFPLAYNWTSSNRESACFLAEQLQNVIRPRAGNAAKVDLLAHSMGGLVARTYIQGDAVRNGVACDYNDDVRKVVFIATPHKGFPFNYRTWEGMIWDDYLYYVPGIFPDKAGNLRFYMNNKVWPGIVHKRYRPDPLEAIACRDVPYAANPCTWAWAHQPLPRGVGSLREMLPTDDLPAYLFRRNPNQTFPHGHDPNGFLTNLNANARSLVTEVGLENIFTIYGVNAPTDYAYEVKFPVPFDPANGMWGGWYYGEADGASVIELPNGDDLVPTASADLSGIVALPAAQKAALDAAPGPAAGGARHVPIMYHRDVQKTYVPRFLTGAEFPFLTEYVGAPWIGDNVLDMVAIMAQCPINFLVTDRQGRRLGFDPVTGQVHREIPNALYTTPGVEPQMILIPGPLVGNLQITATGYAQGSFSFSVDRIDQNGILPLETFEGETFDGKVDTFDVEYPAAGQQPVAPQVDAGIAIAASEGDVITFRGSIYDLNFSDTHAMEWDFGDGTRASGTLRPEHGFADNGDYTVTFRATDGGGLSTADTLTATVSNAPPTVEAGGDVSLTLGEPLSLMGSFQDPGAGDTHAFLWDLGDGTSSDTLGMTHTYTAAGTYTAKLTVTDDDGGQGQDTLTVVVLEPNRPPVVQAGPDVSFQPGQAVSFQGSFIDPDATDSWEILWDFGDGATAAGTLTPAHTYADCSTFTVLLTVTDSSGASGADTITVRCDTSCPFAFVESFDRYGAGVDPPEWSDFRIAAGAQKGAFRTVLEDGDVVYESIASGVTEYRAGDSLDWNNYDFTGSSRLEGDRFAAGALLAYSDLESGRFYALVLAKGKGAPRAALVKLDVSSDHSLAALEKAARNLASQEGGHRRHSERDDDDDHDDNDHDDHDDNDHDDDDDDARWYAFRIRVESTPDATRVRARLWPIDEDEPTDWWQELRDRLTPLGAGAIGVAALGDDFAVDDLRVEALAGSSSAISGDRDGDGLCDGSDNCPAKPNPDQIDKDGDGIGDVCDDCVAPSKAREICLDEPGGNVGGWIWGHVTRRKRGGVCGAEGFYQLGPKGGLALELAAKSGRYRLRFQVEGRLADGDLWLELDGKRLPIRGVEHPKERWSWTDPVVVRLDGKTTRWRLIAKSPVGIESLWLEGDCGRPTSPKCSHRDLGKPPGHQP